MPRRRNYKIVPFTDTIREILESGNVLEELHGEMEEWQSSLESNSMEHLPKYEEVQAAVEALDSAGNTLESASSSLISALEDAGDLLDQTVSYTIMVPYKGRSHPRWMTCANAIAPFQAVVSFLEDEDNLVKKDDDGEPISKPGGEGGYVLWTDDENNEIESYRDELSGAVDEAEQVEFPGMFS